MTDRKTGTVKWFNRDKGFGYIGREVAGPDVFVHFTETPGGNGLEEGTHVSYDEVPGPKGPNAKKVTPL